MTSAKFMLPGLLLAIGVAPALANDAAHAGSPHGAGSAKVAAPAAEAQPAPPPVAAAAAADSAARPKPKRHRHRKAAAPGAGKEARAAVGGQEAPAGEAGHSHDAPPAPVVAAAVAPTPRVQVRDRAAAAVAVAAAQATDGRAPQAHVQAMPAPHALPDEHPSHAATAEAPAAAAPARGDECNPPFRTEVAALFDRWNASLRSGDPKKVVANYAPDSVLLPTLSNRVRFTAAEKEEYFLHFLQRGPEGRIDDRVIDVDCNSAVDSGLYTFRFTDGSSVRARYTFAYKRVGGDWLISSHHSSAMPEKAGVAGHGAEAAQAGASDDGSPVRGWVRFP